MIDLPADIIRAGFKLIERDEQRLVHYAKPLNRSRTTTIQRRRYILVSQNSGVAPGLTLDEAIRAARDLIGFIAWVEKQKREGRS